MRIAATLCAAALLALPATARAATATYTPTSQWAIDYGEFSCKLMRNFAYGEHEVTLGLIRAELGPRLVVEIAGAQLDFASRADSVHYRFGPGGGEREGSLARLSNAVQVADAPLQTGFDDTASWTRWTYAGELAAARNIRRLTVSGSFGDEIVLELGDMEAPVAALQTCVDDLMQEWGLDPQRLVAASRHARPASDPQNWLGKKDYPRELSRVGIGGLVRMRLIVSEQGRVERCMGVSRLAPLSDATCKALIERARFLPALDAEGKPMTGLYIGNAFFRTISLP